MVEPIVDGGSATRWWTAITISCRRQKTAYRVPDRVVGYEPATVGTCIADRSDTVSGGGGACWQRSSSSSCLPSRGRVRHLPSMATSIAREVRGDNVFSRIAAASASREQMLSRALKLPRLSKRQALFGGERGSVMPPHRLRAVVARSALALESFVAKTFEGFLAHGSPENG